MAELGDILRPVKRVYGPVRPPKDAGVYTPPSDGDKSPAENVAAGAARSSGGSSSNTAANAAAAAQANLEAQQQAAEAAKAQAATKAAAAAAAKQVLIQQALAARNQGTRTDLTDKYKVDIPVETQPYIEKRVIEQYKDPKTGKKIPITKIIHVDPTGRGEQKERDATEKEKELYKETEQSRIYTEVATDKRSVTGAKIKEITVGAFEKVDQGFKDKIVPDISRASSYVSGKLGGPTSLDEAKTNIKESTIFLESKGVPSFISKGGEVISGAGLGMVQDIKENPLKNIALYGAGVGMGAGAYAGIRGLTFIPKVGGVLSTTAKVGVIGYGAYAVGAGTIATGARISITEGAYEKGEIGGVFIKDTVLIGLGFGKGFKLGQQVEGAWVTRGRAELETPQGIYPAAPTKTHLKLFKENIVPELSGGQKVIKLKGYSGVGETVLPKDVLKLPSKVDVGRAGAYHVTPDVFFGKGKPDITPQPGTSEIAGLYGSTFVSKSFAGISGSSEGKIIGKDMIKDLLTPPGSPGIAFLKPFKFRQSPAVRTPNIVEGQEFSFKFKKPAEQGVADVPSIKTEIEAIFRKEAGDYGFESGKFYTKIDGVRVKIDVFDPVPGTAKTSSINNIKNVIELETPAKPKLFSESSYSLPSSSSRITTSLFTFTEDKPTTYSSSITSTPSITSITSSPKPSSPPPVSITPSSSSGSSRGGSYSPPSSLPPSSLPPSSLPPSSGGSSSAPSSSYIPSSSGGSSSRGYGSVGKNSFISVPLKLPKISTPKQTGSFGVQIRRGGQFFNVGSFKTQKQAFQRGKQLVSTTLAATFKLTSPGKTPKAPKGFYTKSSKMGNLFIEKSKFRLSKLGEISEIQATKKTRKKKKKK